MLEIRNISKKYKDFILDNINFSVDNGSYFVLLGESGAGKSLILEIIAGLILPDKGEVVFNGINIKNQKSIVGLVFQDYAIFPHLTVKDNIAYALKAKKQKKVIINNKVDELTKKMNINHLTLRQPKTLSGGELQRVALARTLALEPSCLLLDEPLTALDVQLRDELRSLLKKINNEGITIIHVTHDFEEAIALADKVGIIHNGRIVQQGTPKEVFHNPKSQFIANLTGIKNFYNAQIISDEIVRLENTIEFKHKLGLSYGTCFIMFRNEDVILSNNKMDSSICNNFQGVIVEIIPIKHGVNIIIDIGIKISALITHESVNKFKLEKDCSVWVGIKASAIKFEII